MTDKELKKPISAPNQKCGEEAQQIIREYIEDLLKIIKKMQRRLN